MLRLATATRFEEPSLDHIALALEVIETEITTAAGQIDVAMSGISPSSKAEVEPADKAKRVHGSDDIPAEPSARAILQKIQPLASEQRALIASVDDLLSNTAFDGEVPDEFDRVCWLMTSVRRIAAEMHQLAYTGLPAAGQEEGGHRDTISIASPVVDRLPVLLEVHRLTMHLHRILHETGADLPLVLSGWVEAQTRAHLTEAHRALEATLRIVAKGGREHGGA